MTGLPARLGMTALLLIRVVLTGADQQLHENRKRESTMTTFDRRHMFNIKDLENLGSSDSGWLMNVGNERGIRG